MRTEKKLCWLSALFAILLSLSLFYFPGMANAKQIAERTDDGRIVVYEKPIIAEYYGVPKEVPTDIALKIINGEQPEYAKKTGTTIYVTSLFPPPARGVEVSNFRVWKYSSSEKKWMEEKRSSPPQSRISWPVSATIIVPMLIILLAGVGNGLFGKNGFWLVFLWKVFATALFVGQYINQNFAQLNASLNMALTGIVMILPPLSASYVAGMSAKASGERNGLLIFGGMLAFVLMGFCFWIPLVDMTQPAFFQCEWAVGIASVLAIVISCAIKKYRLKKTEAA